MRYTFGGIQELDAWHWTPDRLQQFGQIVYLLLSGDAKKRGNGWNEFYEFKRHFMAEEFQVMFDKLEAFRQLKGVESLQKILNLIGNEFVEHKKPLAATPEQFEIPDLSFTPETQADLKFFKPENCEQMSMF